MSATDIRTDYSMTAGEALPIAVRAAGCRIETEDGTLAIWTRAAARW